MMDIYAVEGNLENLVLVDGTYVVNGSFDCKRIRGTSELECLHSKIRAQFVMPADIKKSDYGPNGLDYNAVINRAERQIKKNNA